MLDTEKTIHSHLGRNILVRFLGRMGYQEADVLQRRMQTERIAGKQSEDVLLLLEHPTVITLGTRGSMGDLRVPRTQLNEQKVQVIQTDRGGQATLHSPGQLVGYFIFHIENRKQELRNFLHKVEQSLINTLQNMHISAEASTSNVGIWVAHKKIASIGICINHSVTRHGFALNICNNIDFFQWIIPCGLPSLELTSVEQELKQPKTIAEVADIYIQQVEKTF